MRIRVTHSLGDLEADLIGAAAKLQAEAPVIVRRNIEAGNRLARGFNRQAAGPHGKSHFKRLTAEMTGPMSGEYGFTGDIGDSVGGGFRNGGGNTDLDKSFAIQADKFGDDVAGLADRLLW